MRPTVQSVKNPPGPLHPGGKAPSGYFFRRLESAEAASCFVVLLVLPLRSAFDAFEATVLDVLTEFFAIRSPPFWRAVHHIGRCVLAWKLS